MRIWDKHPANVREGDRLCDDHGTPFATVTGSPVVRMGVVTVPTDVAPVEFPAGTFAVVDRW